MAPPEVRSGVVKSQTFLNGALALNTMRVSKTERVSAEHVVGTCCAVCEVNWLPQLLPFSQRLSQDTL